MTELALLIAVVGLVFIGMEVYIKRGLQGKMKDLTDHLIGEGQEAFQQETLSLKLMNSTAAIYASSVANSAEGLAGTKSLAIDESSNTTSSSMSSQ